MLLFLIAKYLTYFFTLKKVKVYTTKKSPQKWGLQVLN